MSYNQKRNGPACPELFEEITGHKPEEMQHVRKYHRDLLIKYVDAYGAVLQKGAKLAEAIQEAMEMEAKLAPEIQRIHKMRENYF